MKLAYRAHHGQTDKSGVPYIYHPIHLAEQMKDELTTVVALLHDVVEDTDYTLDDLRAEGFSDEAIEAIAILTRKDGEDYMNYVGKIAQNNISALVKIADLEHNSDLSRLDGASAKDLERAEKYKKAIEILRQKMPKNCAKETE